MAGIAGSTGPQSTLAEGASRDAAGTDSSAKRNQAALVMADWPEPIRFLATLFDERDQVLFRPMETWAEGGRKQSRVIYKSVSYPPAIPTLLHAATEKLTHAARTERANIFFGVCPRFGDEGQYDLAWQIRKIVCLWADIVRRYEEFTGKKAERVPAAVAAA